MADGIKIGIVGQPLDAVRICETLAMAHKGMETMRMSGTTIEAQYGDGTSVRSYYSYANLRGYKFDELWITDEPTEEVYDALVLPSVCGQKEKIHCLFQHCYCITLKDKENSNGNQD